MVAEESIKKVDEEKEVKNDEEIGDEQEETEMTNEEKIKKAEELFKEGKRHLLSNNLPDASSSLADACKLFVEVHGVFAAECFEPHFQYGKTLLELGRLEPGVFTNALQGVDGDIEEESGDEEPETADSAETADKTDTPTDSAETDDKTEEVDSSDAKTTETEETKEKDEQFEDANKLTEEEREDLHEQVEEALEENAEKLDEGKDLAADEPEDQKAEEKAEGDEGGSAKPEEEDGGEEGENVEEEGEEMETGRDGDEGDEDADQLSNLQLAWEALDVARVICEKQEDEKWKLRLLDVLMVLAEVSIEDERYEKAQEDLELCIKMQKELLPDDSRALAEGYFQLGRLFNLIAKYTEAADQFKLSLTVLEARIASLKEELSESKDEEKAKLEKEIGQLEALIPEIQTKVDDCLESQKTADAAKAENGEASSTDTGFEENNEEMPAAKDISNLVRKPIKRKDGTVTDEDDQTAKRAKSGVENEQQNGDIAETNGHAPEQVA